MLRLPVLALLLVGLVAPREASAMALAGLATSFGPAAALLALLVLQGSSPAVSAALLGAGSLLLLVLQLRLRRRVDRPVLARVRCDRAEQALLAAAREQFLCLQKAWDGADLEALRTLTMDCMFDELLAQLPERGAGANRTDVLALEAHLISHETVGPLELASIEFSGVVRESAERGAVPFREVWMLARRGHDGAWRLARQQALL